VSLTFYTGAHHPDWLSTATIPLFLSCTTLARYRSSGDRWPVRGTSGAAWAGDSGAYAALMLAADGDGHPWSLDYETYGGMWLRLADEIGRRPDFVAPQDWPCETDLGGVGGRARIRRQTLDARVARTVDLVKAEPDEPWLLWCGLNDEAEKLAAAIPGAVNVTGSMTPEEKAEAFLAFADGGIQYLVCKPSIAAFGLNFQHCARMAFVGLNDSMETYYQAIRRCYRYGQARIVNAHVVTSEIEGQIAANVARKEAEAGRMIAELVAAMHSGNTLGVAA
jgi:hypothetical protein